jgi:DNA-binding CsgD family transcriptional regulator
VRNPSGRRDWKERLLLVQAFVERLRSVESEAELFSLMDAICNELGFRYFALIHHTDLRHPRRGLININNYPPVWADHFIEQQLYRTDPVVHACFHACTVFRWSELPRLIYLNATHREILDGAAGEGLSDGITIPGSVIGERGGSCSLGGPRNSLVIERFFLVGQLVGAFAFAAARRIANGDTGEMPARPVLSRRQRQCTVLAGQGKKDLAIAHALDVSYRTVVNHLDAARKRYHVPTREQLIIRAILDGDISLAELDTRP